MKNHLIITALLAAFVLVLSCSDDDNPTGKSGPGNELSLYRTSFQQSSQPLQVQGTNAIRGSKILWHGLRDAIPVTEIWDSSVVSGNGVIRPFRIISRPDSLDEDSNLVQSWNGLTSSLEEYGFVYNDSLVLEIRMRADRGLLHLDIGQISEDIDGDGSNDTEDTNQNGVIEEDEDIGLDGLANPNEPGYSAVFRPDPQDDDWYFDGYGVCPLPQLLQTECDAPSNYYEWLNGTEGNREDPAMQGRPDEERLGPTFDTANGYLSVMIDLSDTSSAQSFYVPGSTYPFPGSNPTNGYWKTWRIPFGSDQIEWIGSAGVGQIEMTHFRVWFQHPSTGATIDTVTVASWRIVHVDSL